MIQLSKAQLRGIVLLAVCYVAAQLFADITSLRIVLLLGFSVDAGTLIYPLTFTLRDMVHKTGGVMLARTLIFAAAALNLFMAGLFWLTTALPADPTVDTLTQLHFGDVLAPLWRIVVASIVAEVIAELLDTEAYKLWEQRFGARLQWGRVLVSNAVSVPLDSAIFVMIAFWGVLPAEVVWSIFLANVILKGIVTLLSIPGIYLVREQAFSEV
ncbi:MAG: queuosine precursor transporter [Phototrophicaceae bacterium]|jgi:uncharacterized integral membrane protein (TIGR00697 family)